MNSAINEGISDSSQLLSPRNLHWLKLFSRAALTFATKKSGTADGDCGEGDLSDGLAEALQGGDHRLLLPHGVGFSHKVDGKGGATDTDKQPEKVCKNRNNPNCISTYLGKIQHLKLNDHIYEARNAC